MIRSSLKNLFSRPYTVRYPAEDTKIPLNSRGRVVWEMKKCIFCRLCEKNCPTLAIKTDKVAKTQTIVRARCIQCNTCVNVCPTNTITMEPRYTTPGPELEIHVYAVGDEPFHYEVRKQERVRKDR
jgi:ech hydrogenase subunit F